MVERALEPIAICDRVSRAYDSGMNRLFALKDVDLSIEHGEFMVVLGPSGSGKTTLLNLIGGIDSPTSGKIVVNGLDLSKLDQRLLTEYRRKRIGFIFQFFNLIPTLTAKENVELASELVDNPRDIWEVLGQVGLKERVDHFPSELSGGEQQRVAIARALVKNPPILLCDEPTGELDFETARRILGVLRRVNIEDQITVLLVTHNSAIGKIADRVIRLRSGELKEVVVNDSPMNPELLEW